MILLVNALSATNLSGRQVLVGHLAEILRRTGPRDAVVLLHHAGNRDLRDLLAEELGAPPPDRLRTVSAPSLARHWFGRALYERSALPRLAARLRADRYLTSAGGWTPGLPCPQVTLALNPWAMADLGPRRPAERFKAALQRRAYRQAVARCDGIGYGSGFMRDLYRANAGRAERAGAIVYPALGAREAEAMDAARAVAGPRDPMLILCVSRMARHKDIGTLIEALRRVRGEGGVPARLRLAGGWSDPAYRREMEDAAAAAGLGDAVEFTGHLSRGELRRAYATARIYALLSRSESFGIPAVEAQRMGTPVVAATGCAAPEVCGKGGLYVDPGDAAGAARHLVRLLTDETAWRDLSLAARENAERFEYRKTTLPLLDLLGLPRSPD